MEASSRVPGGVFCCFISPAPLPPNGIAILWAWDEEQAEILRSGLVAEESIYIWRNPWKVRDDYTAVPPPIVAEL